MACCTTNTHFRALNLIKARAARAEKAMLSKRSSILSSRKRDEGLKHIPAIGNLQNIELLEPGDVRKILLSAQYISRRGGTASVSQVCGVFHSKSDFVRRRFHVDGSTVSILENDNSKGLLQLA
ncbi:unnamed protein product [Polarella glacialis]|uniref:Uncharacterized protein n=1 Tax=Polarella glacialis TaxID=89957 RepID=A0A813ET73_POLGL|nr:unnamed protein product [Polarella glacialis]